MIQGLALVVATCAVGVKGQILASWSFLGEGDMVLVVGHADDLPELRRRGEASCIAGFGCRRAEMAIERTPG